MSFMWCRSKCEGDDSKVERMRRKTAHLIYDVASIPSAFVDTDYFKLTQTESRHKGKAKPAGPRRTRA